MVIFPVLPKLKKALKQIHTWELQELKIRREKKALQESIQVFV